VLQLPLILSIQLIDPVLWTFIHASHGGNPGIAIFQTDITSERVLPGIHVLKKVGTTQSLHHWILTEFHTGYCYFNGLEGPGIESRWGETFRTYPDRLRGPPSLLYNGYRVFPRGKGGRGVMLTTHRLLVPRLRKSWAILPLTLWVLLGLLRGSLYLNCYFKLERSCFTPN
jgi:hypothetical protein